MRIGLHVVSFTWPGEPETIAERLRSIASTAEDAGFSHMSVMDHFFQMEMLGDPAQPMLEAYAALNYLAASTSRMRLGALVTGVNYRHPGALIKAVTTLDVLSGGRAELGIGAGWYEREARGLGLPFPPLKERFERLEETLQIAHRMWSEEPAPFEGKHYTLAEPLNRPRPISRPHPPITIGGLGERKTLRLVAQYGDACNFFAFVGPEVIRLKLETLRRHCDAVGRAYGEIERTALADLDLNVTSAGDAIKMCAAWSEVGIQRLMLMLPNEGMLSAIATIGEKVIPVVSGFTAR